jgi:ribosomal protein S24E
MSELAEAKKLLNALDALQQEFEAVAKRKLPVDLNAAKSANWKPGGGIEGTAMDFYDDERRRLDNQKVVRCYTAAANLLTLENQLVQAFVNNPGGIIYEDFKKLRFLGRVGAKFGKPFAKLAWKFVKFSITLPLRERIAIGEKNLVLVWGGLAWAVTHPSTAAMAAKRVFEVLSTVLAVDALVVVLQEFSTVFGKDKLQQKVSAVAKITQREMDKLRGKALTQYASSRWVRWKYSRKNS